ncbi:MAG: radical SAM protein [Nitrospirae bacterium]|nr:radical SAM protein [Nitrospirota bacterium]
MDLTDKIKVGLVQIGNSFSGQYYLPYSIGLLQAYAQNYLKNPDDFEFLLPVYNRVKVNAAKEMLGNADIVLFSTYLWNFNLSIAIARELKLVDTKIVIVFGGHQVPKNPLALEKFLSKFPFIDIVCFGEGEIPILKILENIQMRSWKEVPSIGYIDKELKFRRNAEAERITDLNQIPSPYLEGVFEPLMAANSQVKWSVMWETNRGCPFSCAFCAWGSNTNKKIYKYDMPRLFEEIDWFSKKKIEFVFCCDANFGIFERDLEIVEYVANNKNKYGYPIAFSVQNTKNSSSKIYKLQRLLTEFKLQKGVNLALQTVNKETLASIKRANISSESYQELQRLFAADDIPTFTDIILGLPKESYASFTNGISSIIENGQYNNIQFINLAILENTDMADPEYQKRYGLILQESKIIYHHGSVEEEEEIDETQHLVVGTESMPKEDWVKARVFSWLVSVLFFDKLLQIPLIFVNRIYKESYKDMFELFMKDSQKYHVFADLYSFLKEKALDIQSGGTEHIPSKDWINIWWPADEYVFINLSVSNQLDLFYSDAERILLDHLNSRGIQFSDRLVRDCVLLNRSLIKQPFIKQDIELTVNFNIGESFEAVLKGDEVNIEEGSYSYKIDRSSETWNSWDEWFREVVWYGKKRGNFLYEYKGK